MKVVLWIVFLCYRCAVIWWQVCCDWCDRRVVIGVTCVCRFTWQVYCDLCDKCVVITVTGVLQFVWQECYNLYFSLTGALWFVWQMCCATVVLWFVSQLFYALCSRCALRCVIGVLCVVWQVCNVMVTADMQQRIKVQKMPYLMKGNQWVGYEDGNSVTEKVSVVVVVFL